MKTAAIIEARMASTRLPGKILLPVLGKPLLELLVERLQWAHRLDQIIVATTDKPSDDVLEDFALRLGIGLFRGSEDDVLDRVLRAAEQYKVKIIVEVTGDCPLIDPLIVDRVVEAYQNNRVDYVSNVLKRTYPRGLDVQVFSTALLKKVAGLTRDPVDHEHVSLYIYSHPESFTLMNVDSGLAEKYREVRLTVDTKEDFNLIREIFERLYGKNPKFGLSEVLRLRDQNPELQKINSHIQQKKVR
jgi:spore coat polysaccharide biosynthesis protein SpsF